MNFFHWNIHLEHIKMKWSQDFQDIFYGKCAQQPERINALWKFYCFKWKARAIHYRSWSTGNFEICGLRSNHTNLLVIRLPQFTRIVFPQNITLHFEISYVFFMSCYKQESSIIQDCAHIYVPSTKVFCLHTFLSPEIRSKENTRENDEFRINVQK